MKSWILASTLPDDLRAITNLANEDDTNDATYQGLVAAVVSLILLTNGILPEGIHSPLRI